MQIVVIYSCAGKTEALCKKPVDLLISVGAPEWYLMVVRYVLKDDLLSGSMRILRKVLELQYKDFQNMPQKPIQRFPLSRQGQHAPNVRLSTEGFTETRDEITNLKFSGLLSFQLLVPMWISVVVGACYSSRRKMNHP